MFSFKAYVIDIARAIGFLSRLPVPSRYFEGHDGSLSTTVRAFPVAGYVIALPGAALLALFAHHGNSLLVSLLALGLTALVTGGLHDDGLADTADGFGTHRDAEGILAIMKDSRSGSYGVIALILSYGLRAAALSVLASEIGGCKTAVIFIASEGMARALMVWHWLDLPNARPGGLADQAGRPDHDAAIIAFAIGLVLPLLVLLLTAGTVASVVASAVTAAAVLGFGRLALAKIGGQTGDTLGAVESLSSLCLLVSLALAR